MEVVAWLREAHADLGKHPHDWHEIVLGPGATPRQVWELWTYSHILHSEEAKRKTWAELDQVLQGMARFVAYAYAIELFHLVTVVEAMLREHGLDHRASRCCSTGLARSSYPCRAFRSSGPRAFD